MHRRAITCLRRIGYSIGMEERFVFRRTDIWREGKYIDLWSVPHVLSGMGLGFAPLIFAGPPVLLWLAALALLVAWEVFEASVGIVEQRTNSVVDVIIGMIGFAFIWVLLPMMSFENSVWLFGLLTSVNAVLSFFGWRESHKAFKLEQRLKKEWQEQRGRMEKRKQRLQQSYERLEQAFEQDLHK